MTKQSFSGKIESTGMFALSCYVFVCCVSDKSLFFKLPNTDISKIPAIKFNPRFTGRLENKDKNS